jgi:hypothetical protein
VECANKTVKTLNLIEPRSYTIQQAPSAFKLANAASRMGAAFWCVMSAIGTTDIPIVLNHVRFRG